MPQWVQWIMQFTAEMQCKGSLLSPHLSALDREEVPWLEGAGGGTKPRVTPIVRAISLYSLPAFLCILCARWTHMREACPSIHLSEFFMYRITRRIQVKFDIWSIQKFVGRTGFLFVLEQCNFYFSRPSNWTVSMKHEAFHDQLSNYQRLKKQFLSLF
jgi:hypothetical protein